MVGLGAVELTIGRRSRAVGCVFYEEPILLAWIGYGRPGDMPM